MKEYLCIYVKIQATLYQYIIFILLGNSKSVVLNIDLHLLSGANCMLQRLFQPRVNGETST